MSIIASILEPRAKFIGPWHPRDPVLADIFGAGADTLAGVTVNERTAMALSAVYACIRVISEDVAKLPLILYRRRSDRGKDRTIGPPLFDLLHDSPNDEMGSVGWRETQTGWALSWGNGYSEIERDGAGRAEALHPLETPNVRPDRTADGQLVYDVSRTHESNKPFDKHDILHLRGLGGNGIVGWSVIRFARESIGRHLAAQLFSASFYGQGAAVSGVAEHPGTLTDDAARHLRESLNKEHVGPTKAGRVMIIEEGMKFTTRSIPQKDAQFIETEQHGVEDVCRWFRVGPHKVQHLLRSTFNNVEQMNIDHVTDTLMPWTTRWEQEIRMKLISPSEPDLFVEHLFTGLLRGDVAARGAFYTQQFQMGVLSQNDIRELENMNPIGPEGDRYWVPLNMQPLDEVGKDEPDDEPDDESDSARRIELVLPSQRAVLADAFRRVLRVEVDKITRARKKPGFNAWVCTFYDAHVDYVRAALVPVAGAVAHAFHAAVYSQRMPEAMVAAVDQWAADYAKRHVDESLRMLGETDSDVAAWLSERSDEVGALAADELAAMVQIEDD